MSQHISQQQSRNLILTTKELSDLEREAYFIPSSRVARKRWQYKPHLGNLAAVPCPTGTWSRSEAVDVVDCTTAPLPTRRTELPTLAINAAASVRRRQERQRRLPHLPRLLSTKANQSSSPRGRETSTSTARVMVHALPQTRPSSHPVPLLSHRARPLLCPHRPYAPPPPSV